MVTFSLGAQRTTYALVFDINSASVGVAVIEHIPKKPIRIHATHRTPINYGDKSDAQSLGAYLAQAITDIATTGLNSLGKVKGFKGQYDVRALVHAPWAASHPQQADSQLEDETTITKDFLRDFMAQHLPDITPEGRIQFDKHITRIALNGYNTTEPYNKDARHVGITMLNSTMAEPIYQHIMNAFAGVVPNHTVHLDSFVFATTQLDQLAETVDAYTIVDIGGEYTSINVVRDSTVTGTSWAPFGTEYLVRAVAGDDPDARSTAQSEVVMFLDNTCTPSQCRKIEDALKTSDAQWNKAFGDACAELSKTMRIPSVVFLSVEKRYAPWFKKAIERVDFGQFTVTGRPMHTQLLTIDHNGEYSLMFEGDAKRDTLLALGALYTVS